MRKKLGLFVLALLFIAVDCNAQKRKVQAAWRALSDYEESVKEGRPNQEFLNTAKEAIDLAATDDGTRKQTKTQAYKLRIYYALYRQNLEKETKKLEATVPDKNERLMTAYGNTGLDELEVASRSLDTIRANDPKFIDKITESLRNNNAGLDDDELRLAQAVQQMKLESGNVATGKYKSKQYAQAADYFYKTAVMNSILSQSKDTANFYNACVSASRSKDGERIRNYNKAMIDAGLATAYNYESLYNLHIASGDTTAAVDMLRRGREMFPSDVTLLTQETNLFLATNRQQDALNNLKLSSQREPDNALYYFVMGNIYDNLANPKDRSTGKELEKPGNFEESFRNAETNYLKAIELNPTNQEYLYNSLYNLGAMYNNYGGYIAGKSAAGTRQQKEIDAQAQEYYKKAIPYLERALALRKEDRATMAALRKLYLLTRNDAKAREMSEKLKTVQ